MYKLNNYTKFNSENKNSPSEELKGHLNNDKLNLLVNAEVKKKKN